MADMLGTQELLSIGRFARVSGLTVKALRHYDDIGLLRPAYVEDSTVYRYYTLAQARDAEAIRRLRSLDVPLEDVTELLHADPATVRERLAVHRARLEGRAWPRTSDRMRSSDARTGSWPRPWSSAASSLPAIPSSGTRAIRNRCRIRRIT
jgi:DNA-binding transcriptional MerR regulator